MCRISGIFGDEKKKQEDKNGRRNKGAALTVCCAVSSPLPSCVLALQVNIYLLVFWWDLSFLEEGELCWSSYLVGGGGCVQDGVG